MPCIRKDWIQVDHVEMAPQRATESLISSCLVPARQPGYRAGRAQSRSRPAPSGPCRPSHRAAVDGARCSACPVPAAAVVPTGRVDLSCSTACNRGRAQGIEAKLIDVLVSGGRADRQRRHRALTSVAVCLTGLTGKSQSLLVGHLAERGDHGDAGHEGAKLSAASMRDHLARRSANRRSPPR